MDAIAEQQTEESNVSDSEQEDSDDENRDNNQDKPKKAGRLKWIKDDRLGKGEVHKLLDVNIT